jgi:hypothetical protein
MAAGGLQGSQKARARCIKHGGHPLCVAVTSRFFFSGISCKRVFDLELGSEELPEMSIVAGAARLGDRAFLGCLMFVIPPQAFAKVVRRGEGPGQVSSLRCQSARSPLGVWSMLAVLSAELLVHRRC